MSVHNNFPKNLICADCGKPIGKPEEGLVRWLEKSGCKQRRNFQIVHCRSLCSVPNARARIDESDWLEMSLNLNKILNPEGLANLFYKPFEVQESNQVGICMTRDEIEKLCEVICRIFIH